MARGVAAKREAPDVTVNGVTDPLLRALSTNSFSLRTGGAEAVRSRGVSESNRWAVSGHPASRRNPPRRGRP